MNTINPINETAQRIALDLDAIETAAKALRIVGAMIENNMTPHRQLVTDEEHAGLAAAATSLGYLVELVAGGAYDRLDELQDIARRKGEPEGHIVEEVNHATV